MSTPSLIARQWDDYPRVHFDRRNLLLHAVSNPLFLAGGLALVASPLVGGLLLAIGGALAMPLAMLVQGIGHKLEREPPAPFAGPHEVVLRIFAEQWITFPRFVLSGGFARAWRRAS